MQKLEFSEKLDSNKLKQLEKLSFLITKMLVVDDEKTFQEISKSFKVPGSRIKGKVCLDSLSNNSNKIHAVTIYLSIVLKG